MLLKTKDLEINEKEKRERIKSQEVVHLTQQVAELNTSVHRYESQLEDFKHSQELSQSSHYEQYFATVDQPIEIEKLKEEVKNYVTFLTFTFLTLLLVETADHSTERETPHTQW